MAFPLKNKLNRWIGALPLPAQMTALLQRSLASDFADKAAQLYATRILLFVIGFGISVLVARILGPEGRGLYSVATYVSVLGIQFGNLGLHASNTYYVAQNRLLLPRLIANTLVWSFIFGGLGAGAAWLVFSIWPSIAPLEGVLLLLALVWIPIGLAYMLMQNLLLGIQDVRGYNTIELVSKIISVLLIGLLIIRNLVSVERLFAAGLVALIISFAWSFARLLLRDRGLASPSYDLFKSSIRYGLRAYIAAFLAFLVLRVDLFLINAMSGVEHVGYYSIAMTLSDMIYMLPSVVGTLLFPRLSAMSTTREKWEYTTSMSRWVQYGVTFLIIPSVLLIHIILPLVYGNQFVPAIPVARLLFISIFFYSLNAMLDHFLASIGFPLITLVVWGATLILKVGLGLTLLPIMGINGVALGAIISYAFLYLSHLVIIQRRFLANV